MSSIIKTIYFHNTLAFTRRRNPIHIYGPENNPQNNDYPATIDYADGHYAAPDGTERYLKTFVRQITSRTSNFNYRAHNLNASVQGAGIEEVLRTRDGLVITAIAVDHGPVPAVAFRVEYKGNSIVYSGDTASTSENMITLSQNADILIYDTGITDTLPPSPFFRALHTTPARIGQVASQANVKKLVLSHLTPITEPRVAEVMQSIRNQGYTGEMVEARDLDKYILPK
jgi:ribonuclease BN (tRNA processing enzyme)